MTTEQLISGLDQLTLEGVISSGWSTADDKIVDWPEEVSKPSDTEITEAAERFEQQSGRRDELRLLPARLMESFQSLSVTLQAKWYRTGVKSGVREALSEGRIDIAKAIIEGLEPETTEEIAVKASLLLLFPED